MELAASPKITRISSSSDGRWGPLYHKYDSASASNHYTMIAAASDVLSSSSSNKGIVQIKSEPYLINVLKGPITGYTSDSLRNNIGFVPKNKGLLFNPIQLSNVIALSIVASVTVFSLCMVRHMKSSQKKMIPTINAYRDESKIITLTHVPLANLIRSIDETDKIFCFSLI